MDGFFHKVLIVDLGARTAHSEPVADDVYRRYLGGKGLGTWLLLRENPPGVDPLSPGNALIFAVGPCTDVRVHGSARYGVFTKSPLTGLYGESYAGGTVADHISRTGYDAVVLKGAATEPVWLEISDREVTFYPAADLWGKSTYQTEDALRERAGRHGIVVIGPAGERLVRFAIIANDYWRCAGRTGAGAVMGAKKVKGIVFRGERQRKAARPEVLEQHFHELGARAKSDPGVASYKKYGTMAMVRVANQANVFPTRYWSAGRRENWEAISGDALLGRFKVQAHACPRCFMACGKVSEVKAGRHQGLKIEGPEYETTFAFGGLCLVQDLEEIAYLNDLCDRLGMDTITAGNLAGFAMLASEQGRIPERITFGDVDRIAQLLQDIVERKGSAAVLAEGIREAARAWGMEHEAVHVKGLEPAGYDPRPLKGMGLAYAVSDRGACHLRATMYKPELAGLIAPGAVAGKAELFMDYEDRATLFDTLILCRFFRDLNQWTELRTIVSGATGLNLDQAGLARIAAGVTNLTRNFNLREGATAADDRLPPRIYRIKITPDNQDLTPEELHTMILDYYRLRGWDELGRPRM